MTEIWTTCAQKAARLMDAGVEVRPVLPAVLGQRVRYYYPAWAAALQSGLTAVGVPDYRIWATLRACVTDAQLREQLLASLRRGDARAVRASTLPPPPG